MQKIKIKIKTKSEFLKIRFYISQIEATSKGENTVENGQYSYNTECFKRNVTQNCKFTGKITNRENWMQ